MKLKSLRLVRFRGFDDVTVEFHDRLTIFVGINGAGKSSLLYALNVAASQLVAAILPGQRRVRHLEDRDVRSGEKECALELVTGEMKTIIRHALGEEATVREVLQLPPNAKPPVVVMLDVSRSVLKRTADGTRIHVRSPRHAWAWDDELNTGFTSFEHLEMWFRDQEDLENQERVRRRNLDYSDTDLSAVRRALERALPNCADPRIDRTLPLTWNRTQLAFTKDGLTLTSDQLSDGERSLLVVAATIARRLALQDSAEADVLGREAVVLFDEPELHLHPRLQREILPTMQATFPGVQFIASTHSPQVLSSVRAENIKLLDHFKVTPIAAATWHRDTNRILDDVFGDPGRPPEVAKKISNLRDAIDEERHEDAQVLIEELENLVEGDDPDVFFLKQFLPSKTAPR